MTKPPRKIHALDTETYRGKAFLLSSAERVWTLDSFEDFIAALQEFETRRLGLFRKVLWGNILGLVGLAFLFSGLGAHLSLSWRIWAFQLLGVSRSRRDDTE